MSCSCGNNCAWGICRGAPAINACPCDSDGTVTYGAHLAVKDGQFCPRELENNVGFLQNQVTGSGQYRQTWTSVPNIPLGTFDVTAGAEFGNLIAINADGFWRQLDFPNVAGLYLSTNAAGQLIASALPALAVPDPLTVTTLNATTANVGALNVSGAVLMNGLGSGTIANTVGLDASGNLIQGSNASGVQSSMFYEAPTSPSATTPNASPTAGSNLVIGNQLYDSGGSIVGVTDGQTLKVQVAGKYRIDWGGLISFRGKKLGAALNLTINGVVVNSANCPSTVVGVENEVRTYNAAGFEMRDLAVNDVIRIQLIGGSYADDNSGVFSLRVGFTKFA